MNVEMLDNLVLGKDLKWVVKSKAEKAAAVVVEEVYDAVVVATGHYSKPRLPTIKGMDAWKRKQMHSHIYRVPEPFKNEVVVVVGSSLSGQDLSMELVNMAKEIHLSARSLNISQGLSQVISKYPNLFLRPQIESLHEDGRVSFNNGSWIIADTIIYCSGYSYSFPFLDTKGIVVVDDDRVGPLFEHTFPPLLAPSLSFIGIPRKYSDKYADYIGFAHLEEWRKELCLSALRNSEINLETYRDSYKQDEEMLQVALNSPHFTQLGPDQDLTQ